MKIHILFAQRKCSYPGQYAPEVLASIDEYRNDENPSYILDAFDSNKETGEFSALEIIVVEVSDKEIHRRLYPDHYEPVMGKVVAPTGQTT